MERSVPAHILRTNCQSSEQQLKTEAEEASPVEPFWTVVDDRVNSEKFFHFENTSHKRIHRVSFSVCMSNRRGRRDAWTDAEKQAIVPK